MRESQWLRWTRTQLDPREREDLLAALTLNQRSQLLDHDYVWIEEAGVLWEPPDGVLRRARFTHGTHFRTKDGEFYIGSGGDAMKLSSVGREARLQLPEAPETRAVKVPRAVRPRFELMKEIKP